MKDLTVNQLVLDALFLIGELSPDETPEEGHINEGIRVLNYLIDSFSLSGLFIPFFNQISFTITPSAAIYTISNLVTADITAPLIADLLTCKVQYNNVQYPVGIIGWTEVDDVVRVTNIQARPEFVTLQNENLLSRLTFYNTPDTTYTAFIRYKPCIQNISYGQALSSFFPSGYERYLKYKLAQELGLLYPTSSNKAEIKDEIIMLEERIKASNNKNLTMIPSSILMGPYNEFNWYPTTVIG
jgi:hypothetical protein